MTCELPSVLCSSNVSKSTKQDANVSFQHQQSMDFSITAQGPKEAIVLTPTNHHGGVDLMYSDTNYREPLLMYLYKIVIVNNSLHTYCSLGKDERADGELLMYYKTNSGESLIICVPIMFSCPDSIFCNSKKNVHPSARSPVKKMIQMAPLKTKTGEQTRVSGLNMNDLFPRGKPFYHEQTASNSNDTCFGIKANTIMIVYDKSDVYILLDKEMEKEFNSKTLPSKPNNENKGSLWVKSSNSKNKNQNKNKNMTRNSGPLVEGFENGNNNDDNDNDDDNNDNDDNDGDDDDDNDIYIDCRPTGSDGKALYEEDLTLFKPSSAMGNFKQLDNFFAFLEKIKDSPAFYLFIGLIIAFVIVKFGKSAVSKTREFLQRGATRNLAQ